MKSIIKFLDDYHEKYIKFYDDKRNCYVDENGNDITDLLMDIEDFLEREGVEGYEFS